MQLLKYLLQLPESYAADPARRWPLILFLHGSGERGDDLERVKKLGIPKIAESRKEFPFIAVSPQCPLDVRWSPAPLRAVLDEVCAAYRVDTDRMYLTGLSMGGYGTWEMAAEFPDLFAAIAPVCGGGAPEAAERLRHLPVWIFHGAKDPRVPVQRAEEMAEALRAVGNPVRLTIYPDAEHNSWTPTYNSDALYQWFLEQRRGAC